MSSSILSDAVAPSDAAANLPQSHGAHLTGGWGQIVFWMAVAFSLFQIWTAAYGDLPSIVVRSVHVGFLLFLTFMLFRACANDARTNVPWHDFALALLGFALGFYHWVFYADLAVMAEPAPLDMAYGFLVMLLVFEAARRIMGWPLPVICALFLAYALFGQYLPGGLAHRGYGLDQIVMQMTLGVEGIFGIPILVSATFIFLFILFGTFLEQAGMIRLFNDIAMGTVGHATGGPAKVSVISSGLMGTINGSGVANVVTTGQFTIPLMKRFGYRPAFAGAVEATASMGGQIMPPVMGAVAFIMAETLDIDYAQVALAATLPAILYFASAFWMVHLEAKKRNLVGLPKSECPNAWQAIKANWHLILPLAALVYLLFSGFTPLYAGVVGLGLTLLLILGARLTGQMRFIAMRYGFWVLLGLGAALYFQSQDVDILLGLIGALILANLFFKGRAETLRMLTESLASGARNALAVGVACALVGVIVGVMTLTGLGGSFARVVLGLAESSVFLALLLTMFICLLLGMGIPTIPNYIITSSMAAPALKQMGIDLLPSHMFVFYFGIMADLTPPVALAAFAASSIAKESPMKIGLTAVKVALAGFVIPFIFIYDPALLMQGDSLWRTAYVFFKAVLAVGLWGMAATGYWLAPLSWPERAFAMAAAACFILALPITDEIGFAATAAFIAWHVWRARRAAPKALAS